MELQIIELQRKTKSGIWSSNLDENFDGPPWIDKLKGILKLFFLI